MCLKSVISFSSQTIIHRTETSVCTHIPATSFIHLISAPEIPNHGVCGDIKEVTWKHL